MRALGRLWDRDPAQALAAARGCGFVIASELQAHGVDFSFTPVLDVDYGESGVIGDRAFHSDPHTIAVLAEALQAGLNAAGMTSVGKHFPGHGYVRADSHLEVPVDDRTLAAITAADLLPFERLVRPSNSVGASQQRMGGIMPAHVIYPKVDAKPAGFSSVWLQKVLREKLGFQGLIFSDDLTMEGASTAGGVVPRANAALDAGCDMVLLCNDPRAQDTMLEGLERRAIAPTLARRLEKMRGKGISTAALEANAAYLAAMENLARVRADVTAKPGSDPKPGNGESRGLTPEFLAGLPSLPGVYRFRNAAGDVIYVGKARRSQEARLVVLPEDARVAAHDDDGLPDRRGGDHGHAHRGRGAAPREQPHQEPRARATTSSSGTTRATATSSSRATSIRRSASTAARSTKGNRYFGPFPSAWSSRETIGHLQRIFLLRTCDDTVFAHRSRPCLLHQIRRCSAPCVNLVSEEDYNRDVNHAAQFLEGKESDVIEELTAKMNAAAEALDYEKAAHHRDQIRMLQRIVSGQAVESTGAGDSDIVVVVERENVWCVTLAMVRGGRHLGDRSFFPQNASGSDANTVVEAFLEQHYAAQPIPARVVCDQLETPPEMEATLSNLAGRPVKVISRPVGESRTWLEMARKNASLAIGQRLSAQATQEARVAALQEFLAAEQPLGRIECFDISHTMGEAPVASCVVYDRGAMQNAEYRRYNVKGVEPGDDYGAMRFALDEALPQARRRRGQDAGPDPHRRRPGAAQRRARGDDGSRPAPAAHDRRGQGRGAQAGHGAALHRRRRGAQAPAARPSRAAPHPAGARRGAPLRHHRPPRAARQGAHRLAPRGDLGDRSQAPQEAARALRRAAGRAGRERGRPFAGRGHQP